MASSTIVPAPTPPVAWTPFTTWSTGLVIELSKLDARSSLELCAKKLDDVRHVSETADSMAHFVMQRMIQNAGILGIPEDQIWKKYDDDGAIQVMVNRHNENETRQNNCQKRIALVWDNRIRNAFQAQIFVKRAQGILYSAAKFAEATPTASLGDGRLQEAVAYALVSKMLNLKNERSTRKEPVLGKFDFITALGYINKKPDDAQRILSQNTRQFRRQWGLAYVNHAGVPGGPILGPGTGDDSDGDENDPSEHRSPSPEIVSSAKPSGLEITKRDLNRGYGLNEDVPDLGFDRDVCQGRRSSLEDNPENDTFMRTVNFNSGFTSVNKGVAPGSRVAPSQRPRPIARHVSFSSSSSGSPSPPAISNPPPSDLSLNRPTSAPPGAPHAKTPNPATRSPAVAKPGWTGGTCDDCDLPLNLFRPIEEFLDHLSKDVLCPAPIDADISRTLEAMFGTNPDDILALCCTCSSNIAWYIGFSCRDLSTEDKQLYISAAYRARNKLKEFREQAPNVFFPKFRNATEVDELGYYKTEGSKPDVYHYQFDNEEIFMRLGGDWAELRAEGRVRVPGFMDWLVNDDKLRPLIEQEFKMYRHHQREWSARYNFGWNQIQLFSLVQQCMRLDLGLYALVACARTDGATCLVSEPVKTFFSQIDEPTHSASVSVDIDKYLKRNAAGLGDDIKAFVAIDDEDPQNCNAYVSRFHLKETVREWWNMLRDREAELGLDERTLRISRDTIVLDRDNWGDREDAKFGGFRQQSCQAGDVLLAHETLPELMTGPATRVRRLMFPSYKAITGPGHRRIKGKDLHTRSWEMIADANRDLKPLGLGSRFPFAFPVNVRIYAGDPLAEAIIGLRRWDDPVVIKRRDDLLGFDDDESEYVIQEQRRHLRQQYIFHFGTLKAAEMQYYGNDSYFLAQDNGNDVQDQFLPPHERTDGDAAAIQAMLNFAGNAKKRGAPEGGKEPPRKRGKM